MGTPPDTSTWTGRIPISPPAEKRKKYTGYLLLAPALLFLIVFFVVPIFSLLIQAFEHPPTNPGAGFTLQNFTKLFTDLFYLGIIWRSLRLAFIVTLLAFIFGYPLAFILARSASRWRDLLIMLAVAPLYTSIVVRVYAWMVILGREGIINHFLRKAGLIQQPLTLMLNETGVVIGLLHVYFAFMVLSIYSVLSGIDPRLEEAAQNLGASPIRTFLTVTFPLSLPGVVAGSLLVFILSLGAYVVPALLGGRSGNMVSNLIQSVIMEGFNWPFGAAIAAVLLILVLVVVYVYSRILGRWFGQGGQPA